MAKNILIILLATIPSLVNAQKCYTEILMPFFKLAEQSQHVKDAFSTARTNNVFHFNIQWQLDKNTFYSEGEKSKIDSLFTLLNSFDSVELIYYDFRIWEFSEDLPRRRITYIYDLLSNKGLTLSKEQATLCVYEVSAEDEPRDYWKVDKSLRDMRIIEVRIIK